MYTVNNSNKKNEQKHRLYLYKLHSKKKEILHVTFIKIGC